MSYVPKTLLPSLLILGLYLGIALLVDPRGEFPLNDDWSFTRSAFRFALETRLSVDEWCAMSLVGQAVYGGLLGKLFGNSFVVLRVSTLVLSCLLSLATFILLRSLKVPAPAAWIGTLTWIFNPIQLSLSFTYMTELPFLFFVGISMAALLVHARTGGTWALAAGAALLGYAFLIRQTALLFLAALIVALRLQRPAEPRTEYLRRALVPAGAFSLFMGAYYLWIGASGGITPATQRKFDLIRHLSLEQVVSNLFGLVFYTALMLLPAAFYFTPQLGRLWRSSSPRLRTVSLAFWTALPAAGLAWFLIRYSTPDYLPSRAYHARMPYLLNVLYDTGLGPVTLDPTYYETPATPVYPGIWWVVTFLVAVATTILGLLLTLSLTGGRARRLGTDRTVASAFLLAAALLTGAFELLFSHIQEGGLFDRHILITAWPLLITLFAVASDQRAPSESRALVPAFLLIGILGYFSVAGTHDYIQWNRLRWELGRGVLARGADPLTVSGGFEFNGWHNYDVFRARGNIDKVFHWWYDERTYLIAMSPQDGYEIVEGLSYYSWLHRMPVSVYLLEQNEAGQSSSPGRPTRL